MTTQVTQKILGPHGGELKLVVLDCPINTWEDPFTRELFTKMIQLKLNGYWAEYPHHVTVTDTSDFIGTHLLVCEEKDGLTPIMGYKSISLSRCRYFNQTFPVIACLKNAGRDSELKRAESIIASCDERKLDISYDSAWTVSKEVRKDRELSKKVRELTTVFGVYYHQDYPVQEWITGGVIKFKTDQYFEWMGLNAITEPIAFTNLGGDMARLLHFNGTNSAAALETAQAHKKLWDERIEISMPAEKVRAA